MSVVIAIANQKGGVGKTTTTVNLSACLGVLGYNCLLIDADPQGSTTSGVGINKKTLKKTTYDVLMGNEDIENCIIPTTFENLDILPADMDLAGADIELVTEEDRVGKLKNQIRKISKKYQFIIIDCAPSLGLITLNALAAANSLIVPMQCEFYSMEGISHLLKTVSMVQNSFNPKLSVEGVILTMHDGRLKLTTQVANEIINHFNEKVYKTIIPRSVRLSEAPSYGLPVYYYDKNCKGSLAYLELTKEFLKRMKYNIDNK